MNNCKGFKHWAIIPMIIVGIIIAVLMAFLLGYFVMLLWNWLMPVIFGITRITYWQAWGLVLLCHILFKFNPLSHGHRHVKKRWHRKEFEEKLHQRFDDDNKENHNE